MYVRERERENKGGRELQRPRYGLAALDGGGEALAAGGVWEERGTRGGESGESVKRDREKRREKEKEKEKSWVAQPGRRWRSGQIDGDLASGR